MVVLPAFVMLVSCPSKSYPNCEVYPAKLAVNPVVSLVRCPSAS